MHLLAGFLRKSGLPLRPQLWRDAARAPCCTSDIPARPMPLRLSRRISAMRRHDPPLGPARGGPVYCPFPCPGARPCPRRHRGPTRIGDRGRDLLPHLARQRVGRLASDRFGHHVLTRRSRHAAGLVAGHLGPLVVRREARVVPAHRGPHVPGLALRHVSHLVVPHVVQHGPPSRPRVRSSGSPQLGRANPTPLAQIVVGRRPGRATPDARCRTQDAGCWTPDLCTLTSDFCGPTSDFVFPLPHPLTQLPGGHPRVHPPGLSANHRRGPLPDPCPLAGQSHVPGHRAGLGDADLIRLPAGLPGSHGRPHSAALRPGHGRSHLPADFPGEAPRYPGR